MQSKNLAKPIYWSTQSAEEKLKTKNDFGKYFIKFINEIVFRKSTENLGKHRYI